MPDGENATGLSRRGHEAIRVGNPSRNRFLHVHVQTALKSGQRHGSVQVMGRSQYYRVEIGLAGEQRVEIGIGAGTRAIHRSTCCG